MSHISIIILFCALYVCDHGICVPYSCGDLSHANIFQVAASQQAPDAAPDAHPDLLFP